MDPVFDAQYHMMKHAFFSGGTEIEIARTPAGDADYIFVADQLLVVNRAFEEVRRALPALRRVPDQDYDLASRDPDDLSVVTINDDHGDSRLTVPEALALLERNPSRDKLFRENGEPLFSPRHVMHTAKLCSATEPEVPCEPEPRPCPPPGTAAAGQDGVRLGVSDTGLWMQPDPATLHPWLAGVSGDPELPGPNVTLPGAGSLPSIPYEGGHGTFVAGVARCIAPGAAVYVGNHFRFSGGELEDVLVSNLEALIEIQSPDLINLSAGAYTYQNRPPLSFIRFFQKHPGLTLVAAAGNDSTDRPFYPAALPPTIAVGALGADQKNRAWFSNYGPWVKVYAPGEGLVNAFATGVYTYQEPPKRPAMQVFDAMARWSGTSFSAPLVAGLIVAEMARSQMSATDAWQAVLATARNVGGFGPVLLP
jgi:hypothetical protein